MTKSMATVEESPRLISGKVKASLSDGEITSEIELLLLQNVEKKLSWLRKPSHHQPDSGQWP